MCIPSINTQWSSLLLCINDLSIHESRSFFLVSYFIISEKMIASIASIIAAMSAPLFMSIGLIIWSMHWKYSSFMLNIFKCTLGSTLFLFAMLASSDYVYGNFNRDAVTYLALSSFLGIIIGDSCWLKALEILGPKSVIIIDSFKPFLSAILGVLILDERITVQLLVGIVVTIVGVLLVSIEQARKHNSSDTLNDSVEIVLSPISDLTSTNTDATIADATTTASKDSPFCFLSNEKYTCALGYILAMVNVTLDAYGSVLTKQFGVKLNTFEISFVRFTFASIFLSIILIAHHIFDYVYNKYDYTASNRKYDSININMNNKSISGHKTGVTSSDKFTIMDDNNSDDEEECNVAITDCSVTGIAMNTKVDWMYVTLGVILVTFICPALSNWALFRMSFALCMTLTALGPVYSIPLVYCMKKETSSAYACLGAAMSFIGVAILLSVDN